MGKCNCYALLGYFSAMLFVEMEKVSILKCEIQSFHWNRVGKGEHSIAVGGISHLFVSYK